MFRPLRAGLLLAIVTTTPLPLSAGVGTLAPPEYPRCEYLSDPVGIDETHPRLSRIPRSQTRGMRQTAYRILVASDAATLAADRGDLWDSGKVASGATVYVPAGDIASVTEGGVPAKDAPGVRFLRMEDGCAVFEVGAGEYAFAATR